MMENYLVTIGITCFNCEETIGKAIESAIHQTYPHVEILIVDDASTDGSIDIIKSYAENSEKIQLIQHEKNRGAPSSYNTLTKQAKGKYICFFDGDDVSHTERVEKTSRALEAYAGDAVCFCDRYVEGNRDRVIKGLTIEEVSSDKFLMYMLDSLCYHYDPEKYCRIQDMFAPIKQHGLSGSSAGTGIMTAPLKAFNGCLFHSEMYRYCDTEWNVRIAHAGYAAINVAIPLMTQKLTDSVEKTPIIQKRCLHQAISKHKALFSEYKIYYPNIHFVDSSFYVPSKILQDETQSLVTIGLLTYNCADTIFEALESALFQTYKNVEVIIVDDASTDSTVEIIKQFVDPRITLVESSINRGAGYNRNTVLEHATGEYLVFFDDDDVALPNRVESQINALKDHEAQTDKPLIGIADFYHYAGGFLGPRHSTGPHKERIPTDDVKRLVWHVIMMHTESKYLVSETCVPDAPYALGTSLMCGKTQVFRALKFDPEFRRMQDLEFLVRFSKQQGELVNRRDPVIHIYSSSGEEKRWSNVVDHSTKMFEKHPDDAQALFGFDVKKIIYRNNLKSKLLKRMDFLKKYI